MPSSKINKKIEVITTTAADNKTLSTHRNRSLQTVANMISQGADAMSVAATLTELYLIVLKRISDTRADLDRARHLQRANDPRWRHSMRAARFACKDEKEYLSLVDRACRGLCDCLGLRTRISFETIAKIYAQKYPDPSEELRRQSTRDLLLISILRKALMFKWEVPDVLLSDGSEDELKRYLDHNVKQGGKQSLARP